jgi:hypothetical protein
MVLLSTPLEATGRRGAVEYADYLIDRFRVGYQFGGGWACGCADFAASDACRHTREAAGRRAAQIRIVEHIKNGSLDPAPRSNPVRCCSVRRA